ncbi:MAG: 3'-5' exoribonuclease YhaM family protein [Syntrophobacteria bacterium]
MKRFVTELEEHESLVSLFLVRAKHLGNTRTGKPFLSVRLVDRTGEIEGRVWERARELDATFTVNEVVRVHSRVERYRDQLQLNITAIDRVDPEVIDPSLFLPSSSEDPEQLWRQLKDLAAKVQNLYLKRLLHAFLSDRNFIRQMKQAPAAKSIHHAYLGGLLEHTVSVTRLLTRICDHYCFLDRDLLVTAGILHDIGKLDELSYELNLDYTDAGRLLGHLVLGVERVQEKINGIKGFPTDLSLTLQHLMISHHGEYEFGAPKRPKTPEAFALHYADDLDAKMNYLARVLEAEKDTPSRWTAFQHILDRYIFKGVGEQKPLPELQPVDGKHCREPRNYSLLDQLDVPSDTKER